MVYRDNQNVKYFCYRAHQEAQTSGKPKPKSIVIGKIAKSGSHYELWELPKQGALYWAHFLAPLIGDQVKIYGEKQAAYFIFNAAQDAIWVESDGTARICELIHQTVSPMLQELIQKLDEQDAAFDDPSFKTKLESAVFKASDPKFLDSVAKCFAVCGCQLEQSPAMFFNQNPKLLSVKNGMVDLETLQIQPRLKEHHFTYAIDLEISQEQLNGLRKDANAELWDIESRDQYELDDPRFFDSLLKKDVFAHAPEIADFLQVYHGYGITGYTDQQYYLFNYGCGSNCKSLIAELKKKTFNPICKIISYEAICIKEGNNDEIYDSVYARTVMIDETSDPDDPKGSQMNWMQVKKFGSGNELNPKAKFKTNREFQPQFNMDVYTNFKLRVPKNCGFADLRRILSAKWEKVYLDESQPVDHQKAKELREQGKGHLIGEKDRQLEQKLWDRRVGFALWVIQGAWKYCQCHKLAIPDVMQKHLKKQLVDKLISPEKWIVSHFELSDTTLPNDQWIESSELLLRYRQCDYGTIDREIKLDPFIRKIRKALERKHPGVSLEKNRVRITGCRTTVLQNLVDLNPEPKLSDPFLICNDIP